MNAGNTRNSNASNHCKGMEYMPHNHALRQDKAEHLDTIIARRGGCTK
jgi:hypothetical protein